MRCSVWVTIGLSAALAGCRSNNDLLEAELRTRENELRDLKGEMCRTEAYNEALQRENQALHQAPVPRPTVETTSAVAAVKEIVLGRQTGGYDSDDCPGDEALQVVLEPQDADGSTIKAPGKLYVEAIEITPEGLKVPLCYWEISPDQLRRSWKSGILSTGYYVILPWKSWPNQTKVRVIARFTLADGRMFEAEKDVTIRLTPVDRRKPLPMPPMPEVIQSPVGPPGPVLEGKAPTRTYDPIVQVPPPPPTRTSLYRSVTVFQPVPGR